MAKHICVNTVTKEKLSKLTNTWMVPLHRCQQNIVDLKDSCIFCVLPLVLILHFCYKQTDMRKSIHKIKHGKLTIISMTSGDCYQKFIDNLKECCIFEFFKYYDFFMCTIDKRICIKILKKALQNSITWMTSWHCCEQLTDDLKVCYVFWVLQILSFRP